MEHEGNRANRDADDQPQPEETPDRQAMYTDSFVRRKVSVKGTGGVAATVVVIAQRGQVWVSIQPLFTWEAIMGPGKVDELMHTLELAREDAKKMTAAGSRRASRGDNAVVRKITRGPAAQ